MKRQLPNLISALRFPLALLFVVFDDTGVRLLILFLAAVSDWIDGPIARRSGTSSRTGQWLDPLADKVFMVAALVVLALERGLPGWVLPLLLLRDIGVALGAIVLIATRRRATLAARRAGKWVTWMQFLAVGLILLRPSLAPWLAPPVAVLGLAALADYARAVRLSPDSGEGRHGAR